MAEANNLPFIERPDLSPYLVHLTKRTKEDGFSAYDNLISILMLGEIWGSNTRKGFVKGSEKASCFMDVPVASLKYILKESNMNPENPRYEPYGVLLTKKYAYTAGARPVLYLSNNELSALSIPENEKWRVVRFDGVGAFDVNWLHEREWRCKGTFDLPKNPYAALVHTVKEARELIEHIQKHKKDFKSVPSSVLPIEVLCQGLPYAKR
ncbi:hypothetical protein [Aquipseudomonas alcaligenes]|uniref:hypothetical protein n=1 Tax=Aquipseudomonas alcaligenes TaxID=43263 RepID=UPI00117A1456|nr:hypothetical protein [Pseudomonas alcaligenes]